MPYVVTYCGYFEPYRPGVCERLHCIFEEKHNTRVQKYKACILPFLQLKAHGPAVNIATSHAEIACSSPSRVEFFFNFSFSKRCGKITIFTCLQADFTQERDFQFDKWISDQLCNGGKSINIWEKRCKRKKTRKKKDAKRKKEVNGFHRS